MTLDDIARVQADTVRAAIRARDLGFTVDGIADLRWVLLNCNEFRFLP